MGVKMTRQEQLNLAKRSNKDEFYTSYQDVENELKNYHEKLRGKRVYCPADSEKSNFLKYLVDNFNEIGLVSIDTTNFNENGNGRNNHYDGVNYISNDLNGNGDFRSEECLAIMERCDVVITNPPFSLFRDLIDVIEERNKDFLLIGNMNAITYKNVFPLFMNGRMRLGYHSNKTFEFEVPEDYEFRSSKNGRIDENGNKYIKVPSIAWFTSLETEREHEPLTLTRRYSDGGYKKYDNYDAIEVSKTKDIPMDYDGIMGVPISYLTKHNPSQFRLVGSYRWGKTQELLDVYCGDKVPPESDLKTLIDGKETYQRLFIRRVDDR